MITSHQLPKFKHWYYKLWTLTRTNFFFLKQYLFTLLPLQGVVSLHSSILSWLCNGGIDNYVLGRYWHDFVSPSPLGLNSLERNDIVLLLLTLGLKAQKHLARGKASASPRVNAPNNFRPARAKAFLCVICSEKGCYRFAFHNTD